MWFGRILNSRSKLEAEHRDDRVDDGDNDRRLIANNFNVLGTSPPSSSCSALDRGDRDSADQSQSTSSVSSSSGSSISPNFWWMMVSSTGAAKASIDMIGDTVIIVQIGSVDVSDTVVDPM